MKKRNGFSLIELLIVVVLLAVVTIFLYKEVMGNIENSKKDAMILSAKEYIKVAKTYLNNNEELPSINESLVVPIHYLPISEGGRSPYTNENYIDSKNESYVFIINKNNQLKFYIGLKDAKENCLELVSEEYLNGTSTKTARKRINANCPPEITEKTTNIAVYNEANKNLFDLAIEPNQIRYYTEE